MTIAPGPAPGHSDHDSQPPREPHGGHTHGTAPHVVSIATSHGGRIGPRDEAEREDEQRLEALRVHWARRPWATWCLVAVNVAMFLLEEVLGGSERSDVLVRLGGLVPEAVYAGEAWRLISSGFLHAGILHIAFNGYVLWVVGGTVERTLGSARFLIVYACSLVVASLASLVLSDAQLTVGASGAVFGLFGVEAIVVFLRPNLLPTQIRKTHARNVAMNLLINVAASFQPNIATVAHFGGGVAGAIVAFWLVPERLTRTPSTPLWAVAGAVCSVLVLAIGLGWALFEAARGPLTS